MYTRLVTLLAQEGHGRNAWRICERSRSRAMLDLLAQSRRPAPAGVDLSWWEEFSTTLDQIRSLDRAISPVDLAASAATRQHHNALREMQRQLQQLLDHTPLAQAGWLDLLRGAPLSWETLRQCLA